jgi:hypothetical protein
MGWPQKLKTLSGRMVWRTLVDEFWGMVSLLPQQRV